MKENNFWCEKLLNDIWENGLYCSDNVDIKMSDNKMINFPAELFNTLEETQKTIPKRPIVYDKSIDNLSDIDGIKVNGQLKVCKKLHDILCPWPDRVDMEKLKKNFKTITIVDYENKNEILPVYNEGINENI